MLKLKLSPYKFSLKHLPGRYMYITDLLSRNFINNKRVAKYDDLNYAVHMSYVCIWNKNYRKKVKRIYKWNKKDVILNEVLINYQIGWISFNKSKENSQKWINYFNNRSEILIEKGIIYYQIRMVVRRVLRKLVIDLLHETHIGSTKTWMKAIL